MSHMRYIYDIFKFYTKCSVNSVNTIIPFWFFDFNFADMTSSTMPKILATILIAVLICTVVVHEADGNDEAAVNNNTLASLAPAIANDQYRQQVVDSLKQISFGTEQFALEFFKKLSAATAGANYNFIVSPFSIWSLLILTAEGAEGNTYTQLQQVLRLPADLSHLRMAYKHIQKSLNVNTSSVEVAINQALFSDINRPVDPEYAYKLENNYQAEHVPVNFHNAVDAMDQINDYVNKQTHGMIRKIVNKDDLSEAQMLMISALFFRGQWKVSLSDLFHLHHKKEN